MKKLEHGEIFKIGNGYFKLKVIDRPHHSKGRILSVYVKRLKEFEENMELPLEELRNMKDRSKE